jgi:hypothetical protein
LPQIDYILIMILAADDEIYEIDTLGNLIRTININSANNSDWEDITQDDLNNFYIGDFGNNNNDRTNLRIYKIPSPTSFYRQFSYSRYHRI